MTEIPDRPFHKVTIDLVTKCETSTSGNKHMLTITNHLTGCPEAFPIPDKSADTIVSTFINKYLPVHMCLRYILSDNGTEFKNKHMDQVLKQLGIIQIFPAPYHPQNNGKLEVFHKYLKPTLKKLCEKDPSNWNQYLNLHQLLEPMQQFLGDPETGMLYLEAHRLTLVIAKKTVDDNHFKAVHKTMERTPPTFKVGDRVYFKNKTTSKWDLK